MNQTSDVHANISVDVWEGDVIVGTFTMGFQPGDNDLWDVIIGGVPGKYERRFDPGTTIATQPQTGVGATASTPASTCPPERIELDCRRRLLPLHR